MAHSAATAGRTISARTRGLTVAVGALSLVFGIPAFVAPPWAADNFPWGVTEFQAMTIGAWALGNGAAVWYVIRHPNFDDVHPVLVYLWSFSILEAAVVLMHIDKLAEGEILTWPYLGMLAVGVIAGVVGIADDVRSRRGREAGEPDPVRVATWARALTFVFILFVALLAVAAFRKNAGASGRVFPETLTPFTVRAFGAFYLSLVLGTFFVLRGTRYRPYEALGLALMPLLVIITAAAFVYIGVFDFGEHPGQFLYIGAYLAVLALILVGLKAGRNRRTSG